MKLYHIDRSGHIRENQTIDLVKNFYTDITENEYFKDGLSSHGCTYFLEDSYNKDFQIDAIFEYERMINYPDKLSRYQALFAFDEKGVIDFIEKKQLEYTFYKIYEIETDQYEVHNINLVRGWSHCTMSKFAKLYWENGEDPDRNREPIYEYLIKLPITIGREVKLSEIKEIIESKKQSENLNNPY